MSAAGAEGILFACDVGNSRVAFALVAGGRIDQVVRVPLDGLAGLEACLRLDPAQASARQAAPVIVSSVNPATTARLRTLVGNFTSGPLCVAGRDFAVPIETCVARPERVGVDRLLAALAAHRRAGGAVIVIDVGTATTVDAVDGAGRFLGGAILPGPSLGAWALHQRTAALPEAALGAPVEPIGRDTESAIRTGLVLGAAGAIERLVAEQKRALGEPARVVATGGGLAAIRAALGCLDDVAPDLVLEGLVAAYLARP